MRLFVRFFPLFAFICCYYSFSLALFHFFSSCDLAKIQFRHIITSLSNTYEDGNVYDNSNNKNDMYTFIHRHHNNVTLDSLFFTRFCFVLLCLFCCLQRNGIEVKWRTVVIDLELFNLKSFRRNHFFALALTVSLNHSLVLCRVFDEFNSFFAENVFVVQLYHYYKHHYHHHQHRHHQRHATPHIHGPFLLARVSLMMLPPPSMLRQPPPQF